MTSTISRAATAKTLERLSGSSGVQFYLTALWQGDASRAACAETIQLRALNVSAEIAERAGLVKYPLVNVYCEKVVNDFKEKFREVSGRVWMGIEVRHSQDRLEGLEGRLELCVDAVTQSLGQARGEWGDGMYFGGAYEVRYGPAKHGGKNFLQAATVMFAVEVGR